MARTTILEIVGQVGLTCMLFKIILTLTEVAEGFDHFFINIPIGVTAILVNVSTREGIEKRTSSQCQEKDVPK